MSIFGDLPTSDYYYLGYIPMVDGYRHASRGHRKCRACIRISQAKYVQNRNRSA